MQFVVFGMHRSGTSALVRVLGLMGCHVGRDDELAPADEANPKGYWERKDVWALDERLLAAASASWHDVGGFDLQALAGQARAELEAEARAVIEALDARRPWAIKDPRLCLTFPFWRPLLRAPVCVLIQRDPLEVARSLQRRDGFPLAAGLALWERHTRDALRHSASLPRALVRYDELCAAPDDVAARLLRDLGAAGLPAGVLRAPPADELRAFLDPALRRQRAGPGEVLAHLNPEQRALYERLQGERALSLEDPGPLSAAGRDALDALARERRARADDVRLLEGLIAEKDAYARSLEALLPERERYAKALEGQLAEVRRLLVARALPLEAGAGAEAATAAEPDWSRTACCTIVSRNYLSLARACCASFLEQHPGARAFVLLADRLEGFDPRAEAFTCVAVEELGIPDFEDFAFKYSLLELNTAVKPFFLERLFETHGVERLFYLDPDIFVFGPLREAQAALDAGQVVLTPHLRRPLPADGRRPQESEILASGTYNLGFIGLRRTDETRELLRWWQERLYDGAYSDPARGLFTDQKWIDLVPGLHRGVAVLRHPGYNAAYWNLHERGDLARDGARGFAIDGLPLRFFHFSGFDRRHPERVSKHQDRHTLATLAPAFRALFGLYARALDAHGWEATHTLPYAWSSFDNGARVPDLLRRVYARLGPARRRFGDPFAASGDGSFFAWATRPTPEGGLSPLLLRLRELRPDLTSAFPDPEGADRERYLDWVVEHAAADYGLGEPYLELFRAAREEARARDTTRPATESLAPPPVAELPARGFKRALRALSPARYDRARHRVWAFYHWLARRHGVGPSARALASERVAPAAPAPRVWDAARPFGVNLFGYFDTESGVGEIARGLAAMLAEARVPHARLNVPQHWLRRGDRRVRDFSAAQPFAIDLLAVNADQAPHVARAFGLAPGDGRYRIGYWFWELARFPPELRAAAGLFHELWAASEFCREAIARSTDVPALKLTPAIVARPAGRLTRADFGLGGDFVFLFVFDAASVVKRKNPGAAIAAFRRAFAPHEPVRLLLKTVNLTARHRAAFVRLARGARVELRDGYLPHGEVLDLLAACDAYVSLHRSEGLGLTLLDALMLGKPVVATRWSGVTEFFDGPGTWPVAHRETTLRRAFGPYPRGATWAEPDVDDAARRLREVYEAARGGALVDQADALRERFGVPATSRALGARLAEVRGIIGAASINRPTR